MEERLFLFGCEESYFFRDGTPFTAGEDIFLSSGFPPSGKVIQGAVRTALLSGHGVDFDKYYEGYCNVCQASAEDCLVLRAVGSSRGGGEDMELDSSGPLSPVRLMGPSSGSTRRPMTSSSWMVKVGWDG